MGDKNQSLSRWICKVFIFDILANAALQGGLQDFERGLESSRLLQLYRKPRNFLNQKMGTITERIEELKIELKEAKTKTILSHSFTVSDAAGARHWWCWGVNSRWRCQTFGVCLKWDFNAVYVEQVSSCMTYCWLTFYHYLGKHSDELSFFLLLPQIKWLNIRVIKISQIYFFIYLFIAICIHTQPDVPEWCKQWWTKERASDKSQKKED